MKTEPCPSDRLLPMPRAPFPQTTWFKPRANDSPSYSSENNGSSDRSAANQEPSAHCLLGCLRGKGHCTFSGLQSHFSDGAILPWPQRMPAAKAATTLRSKKENYNQRIGKGLLPTLGLNLPGEKCLTKAAFPQLPLWLTAVSQLDH